MEQTQITEKKSWFDRYYKLMFIIPIIILVLSIVYLGYFYSKHKDFIYKDVSLSGGTTISLTGDFDTTNLETTLKSQFSNINFKKLNDLTTGKRIAFIIEIPANSTSLQTQQLRSSIESILGYNLTNDNSSTEETGPSLSQGFYKQLIIALIISFVLMSIVILFLFKSFIPSIAVIFAAFADIIMPLALLDILGIRISAAGIAAFLMLIGYSVDTDILLTSRALRKGESTLNKRIFGAFKTGVLMTGTALAAVLPAFFIVSGLPDSFRQIFLILALGLIADIINTWLTNVGIIKWYCQRKGII